MPTTWRPWSRPWISRDITMVGHSTGGGEVARYIGRHGTKRVVKAVLIAAVPPIMLKTAANPEGLPIKLLHGLRAALLKDRSQTYKEFAAQFFGANRSGAQVSQGNPGSVLALEHAVRPQERVREHQGLF